MYKASVIQSVESSISKGETVNKGKQLILQELKESLQILPIEGAERFNLEVERITSEAEQSLPETTNTANFIQAKGEIYEAFQSIDPYKSQVYSHWDKNQVYEKTADVLNIQAQSEIDTVKDHPEKLTEADNIYIQRAVEKVNNKVQLKSINEQVEVRYLLAQAISNDVVSGLMPNTTTYQAYLNRFNIPFDYNDANQREQRDRTIPFSAAWAKQNIKNFLNPTDNYILNENGKSFIRNEGERRDRPLYSQTAYHIDKLAERLKSIDNIKLSSEKIFDIINDSQTNLIIGIQNSTRIFTTQIEVQNYIDIFSEDSTETEHSKDYLIVGTILDKIKGSYLEETKNINELKILIKEIKSEQLKSDILSSISQISGASLKTRIGIALITGNNENIPNDETSAGMYNKMKQEIESLQLESHKNNIEQRIMNLHQNNLIMPFGEQHNTQIFFLKDYHTEPKEIYEQIERHEEALLERQRNIEIINLMTDDLTPEQQIEKLQNIEKVFDYIQSKGGITQSLGYTRAALSVIESSTQSQNNKEPLTEEQRKIFAQFTLLNITSNNYNERAGAIQSFVKENILTAEELVALHNMRIHILDSYEETKKLKNPQYYRSPRYTNILDGLVDYNSPSSMNTSTIFRNIGLSLKNPKILSDNQYFIQTPDKKQPSFGGQTNWTLLGVSNPGRFKQQLSDITNDNKEMKKHIVLSNLEISDLGPLKQLQLYSGEYAYNSTQIANYQQEENWDNEDLLEVRNNATNISRTVGEVIDIFQNSESRIGQDLIVIDSALVQLEDIKETIKAEEGSPPLKKAQILITERLKLHSPQEGGVGVIDLIESQLRARGFGDETDIIQLLKKEKKNILNPFLDINNSISNIQNALVELFEERLTKPSNDLTEAIRILNENSNPLLEKAINRINEEGKISLPDGKILTYENLVVDPNLIKPIIVGAYRANMALIADARDKIQEKIREGRQGSYSGIEGRIKHQKSKEIIDNLRNRRIELTEIIEKRDSLEPSKTLVYDRLIQTLPMVKERQRKIGFPIENKNRLLKRYLGKNRQLVQDYL